MNPLLSRSLAVVLLVSSAALAEEHAPPLTYLAAKECPSREAFLASVERRGASWEAVGSTQPARLFEIVLAREGSNYVGKMAVKEPNRGSPDERNIHGKSCEEVAEALSFTLALEPEFRGK